VENDEIMKEAASSLYGSGAAAVLYQLEKLERKQLLEMRI
jgi:hypothetical protein